MATKKTTAAVKAKKAKTAAAPKRVSKPAVKSVNVKPVNMDMTGKKFTGVVVSDKMNKTIVVKVESVKVHPKYNKRYVLSRRYKVHDEKEQYHAGDNVFFIACRPFSKDKKWRVLY